MKARYSKVWKIVFLMVLAFGMQACELDNSYDKLGPEAYIIIPGSFTPNDDGVDDVFLPLAQVSLASYHLSIRNDNPSTEVFSSDLLSKGWDGSYNGTPLPTGTYFYLVRYQADTAGKVLSNSGYVQLIR